MHSIKEKLKKSKYLNEFLNSSLPIAIISVFLLFTLLIGVGQLVIYLRIKDYSNVSILEKQNVALNGKAGDYVASKNGAVYYFPWCGMVGRIKEENRIWFSGREEAEQIGYRASKNCHGLN